MDLVQEGMKVLLTVVEDCITHETPKCHEYQESAWLSFHPTTKEVSMSEQRNPQNTETEESGLLLSVDPMSERSPDSAALSDDTDTVDTADPDGEDIAADSDGTDAADTDTTDDADGTD